MAILMAEFAPLRGEISVNLAKNILFLRLPIDATQKPIFLQHIAYSDRSWLYKVFAQSSFNMQYKWYVK